MSYGHSAAMSMLLCLAHTAHATYCKYDAARPATNWMTAMKDGPTWWLLYNDSRDVPMTTPREPEPNVGMPNRSLVVRSNL